MTPNYQTIRIAAAILTNSNGELLLVRKSGTRAFMQPGGKMEAGERPERCLIRELSEELQIHIGEDDVHLIGNHCALAANEPNALVEATLFAICCDQDITVSAEIAEAKWVDPNAPITVELAPLTRHIVLPLTNVTN